MGTLPIEAAQCSSQPRLGISSTAVSRTVNFHQLELIAVGGESFFVDVFALDGRCGHGGMRGRDKARSDQLFIFFFTLPPFGIAITNLPSAHSSSKAALLSPCAILPHL